MEGQELENRGYWAEMRTRYTRAATWLWACIMDMHMQYIIAQITSNL